MSLLSSVVALARPLPPELHPDSLKLEKRMPSEGEMNRIRTKRGG